MEKVFNGKFGGLANNIDFKVYYSAFLVAYSDICSANLSSDAQQRGFITQTVHVDELGSVVSKDKPIVREIFIEPKFLNKYDEYASSIDKHKTSKAWANMFQLQNSIGKNVKKKGIVTALTDAVKASLSENPNWQMLAFHKKAGCASATTTQLQENFWRASLNIASVQKDKIQIKNAKNESVAFKNVLSKRAFYESCIERLPTYDQSGVDYCTCMEKGAKQTMTKSEYEHYSKDFSLYYREVTNQLAGKPANDRIWVLNAINNACNG